MACYKLTVLPPEFCTLITSKVQSGSSHAGQSHALEAVY